LRSKVKPLYGNTRTAIRSVFLSLRGKNALGSVFSLYKLHQRGYFSGFAISSKLINEVWIVFRQSDVHGLAMWWNLKNVRPEPQPNKNTKDEANKQKPNRITSAETAADSDKMPKLTTSSHHIAKSPVVCCAISFVKSNQGKGLYYL